MCVFIAWVILRRRGSWLAWADRSKQLAASFDIVERKFILRTVDMASVNPQGLGMITLWFVVLQEGILPINFGLIARKPGMRAAECSFPEIPG